MKQSSIPRRMPFLQRIRWWLRILFAEVAYWNYPYLALIAAYNADAKHQHWEMTSFANLRTDYPFDQPIAFLLQHGHAGEVAGQHLYVRLRGDGKNCAAEQRRQLKELFAQALVAGGEARKQWYMWRIAEALHIYPQDLWDEDRHPLPDEGVAPDAPGGKEEARGLLISCDGFQRSEARADAPFASPQLFSDQAP